MSSTIRSTGATSTATSARSSSTATSAASRARRRSAAASSAGSRGPSSRVATTTGSASPVSATTPANGSPSPRVRCRSSRASRSGSRSSPPSPPPPPREAPPQPIAPPAAAGWPPVAVRIPGGVEKPLELGPGGAPFAPEERRRGARRAMQRIDWQMGVLLRTFFDLRLHRAFGFPSASRYVAGRLGLSARKARALVALERGLRRTPALTAAYREGALSWLRALTVLPVATADDAWVARAGEVTLRRLVAEVEWALDRRDAGLPSAPPSPDATLAPVEWQMRARADEVLGADIPFTAAPSVVALFRAALDAFRSPGEPLWKGCEKLLEHVCREWEAQPRHRDPVFARDGWRCAVPACTSRAHLHDHHILYRSAGGDNSRANRVAICV